MTALRLDRLDLREIELPLEHPFETSFGRTTRRRVMIVRVWDADGAVGYGESTAPEDPFYNHETIDTAWLIVTGYAATLLADARVAGAADVGRALAPIRGNRMATGGIETAVWDLEARRAGQPLWRHIGGSRDEIPCGVSIGLQPTVEGLLEKVRTELASGYQRIKIKIKPKRDVALVEAVRREFPSITLSVDANAAYTLDDLDIMRALDRFDLLMIEQPLAAGDLVDHAKLQRELRTAICLDESITSRADARHALELGSCRIVNVKLGRVGGFAEAKAIERIAVEHGIPVWCGGMLESGIGRTHNIAMSTLEGFTLPGDVSASARYWQRDVIIPPVTVSSRGTIVPPSAPGMGFEVDEPYLESLTVRRETVSLRAGS